MFCRASVGIGVVGVIVILQGRDLACMTHEPQGLPGLEEFQPLFHSWGCWAKLHVLEELEAGAGPSMRLPGLGTGEGDWNGWHQWR